MLLWRPQQPFLAQLTTSSVYNGRCNVAGATAFCQVLSLLIPISDREIGQLGISPLVPNPHWFCLLNLPKQLALILTAIETMTHGRWPRLVLKHFSQLGMQNFMASYVNIVLSLYLLNCFRWVNMLYVELSMMNETRVMVLIILRLVLWGFAVGFL